MVSIRNRIRGHEFGRRMRNASTDEALLVWNALVCSNQQVVAILLSADLGARHCAECPHLISKAVSTMCPTSSLRRGAGAHWSSRILTQQTESAK